MTAQQTRWETNATAGHELHGQAAVYDAASGEDIALVYNGEAHGHLIAAAPELLDALENLIAFADRTLEDSLSVASRIYMNEPGGILSDARAAIAKARGE